MTLEIEKQGLGICYYFPPLTLVTYSRPIHDAQDLITIPIFNLNVKDSLERNHDMVSKCCSWSLSLRWFNMD